MKWVKIQTKKKHADILAKTMSQRAKERHIRFIGQRFLN